MRADSETTYAVSEVLEWFCAAVTAHDADAILALLAPDADVVLVTSEEPILRGPSQLERFLRAYAAGSTTFSWNWRHVAVSAAGPVAWLFAEGVEHAVREADETEAPYRLTLLCERRGDCWLATHIHGSSPHAT